MCKLHELKTDRGVYDAVAYGTKNFEYRKNDRGFQESDILRLREYIPEWGYTGRWCDVMVQYMLRSGYGLPEGYCVMGLSSPLQVYEPE